MKERFTDAKVGEEVVDKKYGKGKITSTTATHFGEEYPIEVKFDPKVPGIYACYYTRGGLLWVTDAEPTLDYAKEFAVPPSA